MPDKFLKATIQGDFRGGKNVIFEADEIGFTQARECLNINLGRKLGIQPREGATIDGSFSTTANPITNAHTFVRGDGLERPIRATGTILEYRNPFVATPDWYTLDTGFTTGKIFGFADGDLFNYMANGAEVIRRWSGAVARFDLATSTATVIGLKSETENGVTLSSAALLGFGASGSVNLNGTVYTYSGISGLTLTGVGATPVGEADGDGVSELPITTGFTTAPLGNILLIKDSRLHIAGNSTNPNNVYGSKIGNVRSFAFSSPAVADDGFVVKFWGKPITALGKKSGYVAVLKEDSGDSISYTQLQSSTDTILTVPKLDDLFTGTGLGAVNQKGTIQLDYDFMFTSSQLGIRRITRAQGNDVDKPETLTEAIETDYEIYDLSDVAMGAFKQQIHQGLRSTDALTGNNVVVIKDTRTEFIGTYQGVNASCFYVFNNKLHFGDSFTKNVWQLYNGDYADFDGTNYYSYTMRWRSRFDHFDFPDQFKQLGFIFLEGYILPNTTATFTMRFETEEGINSVSVDIVGTDGYVHPVPSSALSYQPLGDKALAFGEDASLPAGARRFFRLITPEELNLTETEFLKVQFQLETDAEGAYIRLSKIRPFVSVLPIEQTKTNKILTNS